MRRRNKAWNFGVHPHRTTVRHRDSRPAAPARGTGTPADPLEAAKWFHRSASLGNPRAQNNLAAMLDNGRGLDVDPVLAAFWFRAAAAQGDSTAQVNLGLLHLAGRGV